MCERRVGLFGVEIIEGFLDKQSDEWQLEDQILAPCTHTHTHTHSVRMGKKWLMPFR